MRQQGVNFQIGQCRIFVDTERTKRTYSTFPKISENCKCGDCKYFETVVTKKPTRLFIILERMGVDLTRQPSIVPDGICSVGPTDKYRIAYYGYYIVYGQLGKTQKKSQRKNADGELESVDFIEHTSDYNVNYTIKQTKEDELIFEFYIESERINAY